MTKEALKLTMEALKIARDQIVDPEYGPIGWDVSRLDEVLSVGKQALAAQPAQEPMCPECKAGVLYECVACSSNNYPPQGAQEPPKYSFKAYLTKDNRIGVVACVVRPDGGVHLLEEIIDMPQEKNNGT